LSSGGQVTYFAGGYGGTATGINNRGQIVGSSDFGGSFPDGHAFLYTAGQLTDLGTLGAATGSQAASINNAGQVVGITFGPGSGEPGVAFLYAEGKMTNLGYFVTPYDINDSGEIVGAGDFGSLIYPEAFLYSDGVLTNLNSLLPDGSDWELLSATAINDKGQIVGIGLRPVPVPPIDPPQYVTRAFLLDTTPEPATLLSVGAGLVGLALLHRKVMRRTRMRQQPFATSARG
jgi:probable HAF family extracellular repeat protein